MLQKEHKIVWCFPRNVCTLSPFEGSNMIRLTRGLFLSIAGYLSEWFYKDLLIPGVKKNRKKCCLVESLFGGQKVTQKSFVLALI